MNTKRHLTRLRIVFLSLILAALAQAGSKQINIQGKLTDAQGNPLTGTHVVTFRLYANANDPAGSAIWTENQGVTTQNGLFNTALGSAVSLDVVPFDKPYTLGIQVAGDDKELAPRQTLGASAYAFGSQGDFNVGGNAGISNSVTVGQSISVNRDVAVTGNVTAGSMKVGGQDVQSALVPSGAIMMFADQCPAGWSRFAALDNAFPLGGSVYGTTGGATTNTHNHPISSDGTHTHGTPNHTHTLATAGTGCKLTTIGTVPGPLNAVIINSSLHPAEVSGRGGCASGSAPVAKTYTDSGGGGQTDAQGAHSHGGVAGNTTVSIMPPYVTVVWCRKA